MVIEPALLALGLLVIGAVLIDRKLLGEGGKYPKRTQQRRCRGCRYYLDGLDDAIVFPAEIDDAPRSSPDVCPECGRLWPMLV